MPARPAGSSRRRATSALPWLGALLALYLLGPIVAFAVRFAVPGEHGFDQPGLAAAALTSAASASIATLIVLVLGVPLAHWLATADTRLSRVIGTLVQIPLALPPVMSGIVLIYIVGPYTPLGELFGGGLTDSVAGVVIAQTFVAAPFLVIGARTAFRGVDPALDDVAASLGHGPTARFLRVAVPAAADGIRAALVLTWLRALGEYGATALLAYHPYTLPVFVNVQFQGSGLPATQAPTAVALILAVIAVVVGVARIRPRRRVAAPPPAREPGTHGRQDRARVEFAVTVRRGGFELRAASESPSAALALLGPSGAGKSLALRAVTGLTRRGDVASVTVAGVAVDALPPETRGIGLVAQGGVLLPRRTVWQQVTFGVGTDPAVAAWWLETLRIDDLVDRLPDELSGGQRQRVALAQALSREPSVILLDEPFSALDGPVRDELRSEFRRLQRERGLATVVVTHDPEEAAYLADDVLVLAAGRVLQSGPLADVYRAPRSAQVARLTGARNVNRGTIDRDGALRCGGAVVAMPRSADDRASGTPRTAGSEVFWSADAGAVRIGGEVGLPAVVADVVELGTSRLVELRLDEGGTLQARVAPDDSAAVGEHVTVAIDGGGVTVWDAPG